MKRKALLASVTGCSHQPARPVCLLFCLLMLAAVPPAARAQGFGFGFQQPVGGISIDPAGIVRV